MLDLKMRRLGKIYVLRLEHNKYYIGFSNDLTSDLVKHEQGEYCEWTKLYKPIECILIKDKCDYLDQDRVTLYFMSEYGTDAVRGGTFCDVKLEPSDIITIKKIINRYLDKPTNILKNDTNKLKTISENGFYEKIKKIIDNYGHCPKFFIIHKNSGKVYYIHNSIIDQETISFATYNEYYKDLINRGYSIKYELDAYILFLPMNISTFDKDKLIGYMQFL